MSGVVITIFDVIFLIEFCMQMTGDRREADYDNIENKISKHIVCKYLVFSIIENY